MALDDAARSREAYVDGAFVTGPDESFDLVRGPGFERARVELLEIDADLIDHVVGADGTIAFKGLADDVAVVCSSDKTYAVTRVETSNEMLLVGPPIDETEAAMEAAAPANGRRRATARARATSHLDLTEIAPRLGRLREMMSGCAFTGEAGVEGMETDDAASGGVAGDGYAFEDVDARVQASATEITRCLEDELVAIEIDGKWRGVDPEYRLHALSMLAVSASGNGWALDALPEAEVTRAMTSDGFIPEMAMNTLRAFATPNDDGASWALDEERVCRALAERVLRDGVGLKNWRLVDMMETWRNKLSEIGLGAVEVREEYLAGLALIERPEKATEAFVQTFIAKDLPTEPQDRFKALWALKPRWSMAELEPYLKGQARPGQTIESQLLKHCRVIQGKPVLYSKR